MDSKKCLTVSFVHGYRDEDKIIEKRVKIPSLITTNTSLERIENISSYFFPRIASDFQEELLECEIKGENPFSKTNTTFKKKPRFGMTGLTDGPGSTIFAATWNGIYQLSKNKSEFKPIAFFTNRFINDPHGIAYSDGNLYVTLTAADALIIIDINSGKIKKALRIDRSLNVISLDKEYEYDWRFISKQYRGARGNWHFNNVVCRNGKIWLNARQTSCMIELDLEKNKAELKTFCWDTPVLTHDGEDGQEGEIIFTSVDGKILIANLPVKNPKTKPRYDEEGFHEIMQRNYISKTVRLSDWYGEEINWCRGMATDGEAFFTTIFGRYDQAKPYFSIAKIENIDYPLSVKSLEINYEIFDFCDELRYMTGFSLLVPSFEE